MIKLIALILVMVLPISFALFFSKVVDKNREPLKYLILAGIWGFVIYGIEYTCIKSTFAKLFTYNVSDFVFFINDELTNVPATRLACLMFLVNSLAKAITYTFAYNLLIKYISAKSSKFDLSDEVDENIDYIIYGICMMLGAVVFENATYYTFNTSWHGVDKMIALIGIFRNISIGILLGMIFLIKNSLYSPYTKKFIIEKFVTIVKEEKKYLGGVITKHTLVSILTVGSVLFLFRVFYLFSIPLGLLADSVLLFFLLIINGMFIKYSFK